MAEGKYMSHCMACENIDAHLTISYYTLDILTEVSVSLNIDPP